MLVKFSLAIISSVSAWRSSSWRSRPATTGSASESGWDRWLSESKKLTAMHSGGWGDG